MKYYFSHAIRGPAGPDVSHDVQAQNCKEAILVANALKKLFPKLELYVPAEHEIFIQMAYNKGYINIEEILDVDLFIIDGMDGVLVYVPTGELQGGRKIEYDHAVATNKPVVIFHKVSEAADWLMAKYQGESI